MPNWGWKTAAEDAAKLKKFWAEASEGNKLIGKVGMGRINSVGRGARRAGGFARRHPIMSGVGLGVGATMYSALPGPGRSSGARGAPPPRSMGGYA